MEMVTDFLGLNLARARDTALQLVVLHRRAQVYARGLGQEKPEHHDIGQLPPSISSPSAGSLGR
jgi:hypothetical protein